MNDKILSTYMYTKPIFTGMYSSTKYWYKEYTYYQLNNTYKYSHYQQKLTINNKYFKSQVTFRNITMTINDMQGCLVVKMKSKLNRSFPV